jgi:hypothetical protein
MTPVFVRAEAVHALDRGATVIDIARITDVNFMLIRFTADRL